jgi:hypothetical protein
MSPAALTVDLALYLVGPKHVFDRADVILVAAQA